MIKPSPNLPKDRTAKKNQAAREREAVIAKLVVKTGVRAGMPCIGGGRGGGNP